MPDNVLDISGELFSVLAGILVLLGAALAMGLRHRVKVRAGSGGHRPAGDERGSEINGPDGYIDSFAGVIEEAGGSLPLAGKIIMVATIVAYFAYLILFWRGQ